MIRQGVAVAGGPFQQRWPWFRRAYVLAVEPASTIPAQGMPSLAAPRVSGGTACAGSSHQSARGVLFEGAGEVADIAPGGAVRCRLKAPSSSYRQRGPWHRKTALPREQGRFTAATPAHPTSPHVLQRASLRRGAAGPSS